MTPVEWGDGMEHRKLEVGDPLRNDPRDKLFVACRGREEEAVIRKERGPGVSPPGLGRIEGRDFNQWCPLTDFPLHLLSPRQCQGSGKHHVSFQELLIWPEVKHAEYVAQSSVKRGALWMLSDFERAWLLSRNRWVKEKHLIQSKGIRAEVGAAWGWTDQWCSQGSNWTEMHGRRGGRRQIVWFNRLKLSAF